MLARPPSQPEIEIFGSQLPEFASVAASYPEIQFVLPVMGWPIDLTNEGHETWKRALATASACDNVAIKIFLITHDAQPI